MKKTYFISILLVLSLIIASPPVLSQQWQDQDALQVWFFLVGTESGLDYKEVGDSTLIRNRFSGKTLLIDAGPDANQGILIDSLHRAGVSAGNPLDYIICTSWDSDHSGGFQAIYDEGMINLSHTVAYDHGGTGGGTLWNVTFAGIRRSPPTDYLPGEVIDLGSGPYGAVTATIITTDWYCLGQSGQLFSSGDENSRSVSAVVTYNGFDVWVGGDLTGDSPNMETPAGDAVANVLQRDIDIYEADHHGSDTSSNSAFLAYLSPEWTVISVHGDAYNFPKQAVLDRCCDTAGMKGIYQTGPGTSESRTVTCPDGWRKAKANPGAPHRNIVITTNGCDYYIYSEKNDGTGESTFTSTPDISSGRQEVDVPGPVSCSMEAVYFLKADRGYDQNLYLYKNPLPGDVTYWDSAARNPSPMARDLWIIPSGNNTVAMTYLAMKHSDGQVLSGLALMKNEGGDYNLYIYNSIVEGDWNYWDAITRNPSPIARDLWFIPAENDTVDMTRTDLGNDNIDELLILKNAWGSQKLFLYNAPRIGDWTYTDAFIRNWNGTTMNFYRAKDEWYIPRSSNIETMAGARVIKSGTSWTEGIVSIENTGGDQNLFVWKVPTEGIDTEPENRRLQAGFGTPQNPVGLGNPQGQDLWIIPQRNDIQHIVGMGGYPGGTNPEDDYDVIGVLGNMAGDNNFWMWKTVQENDTTYNQALLRQDGYPRPIPAIPNYGKPQAKDFWMMPAGNNVVDIAAIPAPVPQPTPTPINWIVADFTWSPDDPETDETVTFLDQSATSAASITSWGWDLNGDGSIDSDLQNPTYSYPDADDYDVTLNIEDSDGKTAAKTKSITVWPAPP